MKKYLVDLYLPAAGKHFDVYLPAEKRIHEVISILIFLMGSLSIGDYQATPDAMLLDAESGGSFPGETTVYDAGIRNASRLIMI